MANEERMFFFFGNTFWQGVRKSHDTCHKHEVESLCLLSLSVIRLIFSAKLTFLTFFEMSLL